LSVLERRVLKGLFADDFAEPQLERDLSLWTIKLYLGILFKEVQLRLDRSNPARGTIVEEDLVREFRTLHAFLQSLRLPVDIAGVDEKFPNSLFLFEVKTSAGTRDAFDFRDSLFHNCLFLLVGNRALVACFDGGEQARQGKDYLVRLKGKQLHPVQVREFAAKIFYMATLFLRVPLYATIRMNDRYSITMVGLDTLDRKGVVRFVPLDPDRILAVPDIPDLDQPVFADWIQRDYAKVLAGFLRAPLEDLNPFGDQVVSYLWNADGTFNDMPVVEE